MKPAVGITPHLSLKPLLYGLEGEQSHFLLKSNFPAINAVRFSEKPEDMVAVFLSIIDYARHAGDYRIIPDVCVASENPTSSVLLYVGRDIKDIRSLAVDIRVTSEIILAKILLLERFRNISVSTEPLQIIPMMPDPRIMLARADAALVVNFSPASKEEKDLFKLDLVEEWTDLTGLPYVIGFWVGREDITQKDDINILIQAGTEGVDNINPTSEASSQSLGISFEQCTEFLSAHSYIFGEKELESIEEFIKFSYYYNVIYDIPDVTFFD